MKPPIGSEVRTEGKADFLARLSRQVRSLVDKEYRRAYRNLRHLPKLKYRSVIDGGANRGSFTDAFLQLHRPERLVLVEAIPELAEKLRARYADKPGLSIVSAALSDRNGEAQFEINRSEASSSLLPIDPRNSEWFSRDLRTQIKEMLVKSLMLQTTADQIGNDLPLFGPGGLGLDSIDALELVVSMEKTFGVGVPNSEVAAKALRTVDTIHDYILEKRAAV